RRCAHDRTPAIDVAARAFLGHGHEQVARPGRIEASEIDTHENAALASQPDRLGGRHRQLEHELAEEGRVIGEREARLFARACRGGMRLLAAEPGHIADTFLAY